MAKGKQTSTGKIPGLGGRNMASASGPSGKAIPGAGGRNMTGNMPQKGGKATGSEAGP